jgi:hypothetical protein
MFDTLGGSGDDRAWCNPKDVVGYLLIVWAVDYIEHSPTRFTQADQKADVILVDAVDLDQEDTDGTPGLITRKNWWRQARLIMALKEKIGRPNPTLCRVSKGVPTRGMPPYVLEDMSGSPADVQRASVWMQAHPNFKPSTNQTPVLSQGGVENLQQQRPPSQLEMMARQARPPLPPDSEVPF